MNTVRVWDLPTRVFHWSLVLCVAALVTTAEIAGEAMRWHFRFGYTVLSLLMFRLVWGLIGGYWSRFRTFVVGPRTILQYLRGQAAPELSVGHNPLGALSVLGLLVCLFLQAAAGLFSDDEIATSGPFVKLVSNDWVGIATGYHTRYGKAALIALVLLHVAAIVFYRVRQGQNLVRPMLVGDKEVALPVRPSRDDLMARILALVLFAFCAAGVLVLLQWVG
ncbi:MAG: cytochrome b/b6 domain-containing protein [Rhodoferax sp.]